jgi:hypothetical protein
LSEVKSSYGKLKEKEKEIRVMDWPGNLPALNPIENCLEYMKSKLKNDRAINSLPKIIRAIKMMWVKAMPIKYFRKLSDVMLRTIMKVPANKVHITSTDLRFLCASL